MRVLCYKGGDRQIIVKAAEFNKG